MYKEPITLIHDKPTLSYFLESDTCKEIERFVLLLNESVQGKTDDSECVVSEIVQNIIIILDQLQQWIREIPPLPSRSRFGNKAFCTYFDKVEDNLSNLMKMVLPESKWDAVCELGPYFLHSIGNRQRIDYGSGHELNFMIWLLCLEKLGLFNSQDHTGLVLRVFLKYLDVMRSLQQTYWLEPAGSHGVWGLDDYQFLPFLFGSSQLIGHKHIRPKSITNLEVIDAFASKYMYLGCIQFINHVKTAGSFFEHSPLLFDIGGAKNWEKVNQGMIKMFRAEVLGKLPIMAHFMFGSLISLNVDPALLEKHDTVKEHDDEECCNDAHDTSMFRVQSCCVQRIPSAIGAKGFQERESLPVTPIHE